MKKGTRLLWLATLTPTLLWAQNNYVATSPAAPTPGLGNVLVGINAGNGGMTGRYNAVTGHYAGSSLTTGNENTFYGTSAGRATTSGSGNDWADRVFAPATPFGP